jgi:hypothetical protein
MSEMTAVALLRQNLEVIPEKDRVQWNTQRALLYMAEKQEELMSAQKRLTEDVRDLRSMVERRSHT